MKKFNADSVQAKFVYVYQTATEFAKPYGQFQCCYCKFRSNNYWKSYDVQRK